MVDQTVVAMRFNGFHIRVWGGLRGGEPPQEKLNVIWPEAQYNYLLVVGLGADYISRKS